VTLFLEDHRRNPARHAAVEGAGAEAVVSSHTVTAQLGCFPPRSGALVNPPNLFHSSLERTRTLQRCSRERQARTRQGQGPPAASRVRVFRVFSPPGLLHCLSASLPWEGGAPPHHPG
jgi:hypothetical protein